MKQILINILSSSAPKDVITAEVNNASDISIQLAYSAALNAASKRRIIYLLGGNNPDKCPFK